MSSRRFFSVLDFSSSAVWVLVAEKRRKGDFHILGAGNARSQGVEDGRIVHMGDAAESLREAIRKAEASSGVRLKAVYYNFNDTQIESTMALGSKALVGDGEIKSSDIDEASETARRLVENFDKQIVYSGRIGYRIDGRDWVANPVGVFGTKLEVRMHILRSSTDHCETWQKLMVRCRLDKAVPVLSPWSTVAGILPEDDWVKKRMVWDLGSDFLEAIVLENGVITNFRIVSAKNIGAGRLKDQFLSLSLELASATEAIEEILITGELSEDKEIMESLQNNLGLPLRATSPRGIHHLSQARYASLVGLVIVADSLEKKASLLRPRSGLLADVKEKALSVINEYF